MAALAVFRVCDLRFLGFLIYPDNISRAGGDTSTTADAGVGINI